MKHTRLLALFAALFLIARPAYAYIDPGTGGMAFQALLAGLLGAVFAVKSYWLVIKQKVAGLLRREPKAKGGADEGK